MLNRIYAQHQSNEMQHRDQIMRDQVAMELRRSKDLHARSQFNSDYNESDLPQNLKTLKRIQDQLEMSSHMKKSPTRSTR